MVAILITIGSILLTLLALWGLARQLRKDLPIKAGGLAWGLVASVVLLAINVLLMRRALHGWAVPIGFATGLVFGLAWGQASRFAAKQGTVYVRRSVLHLIFWGLSYALTQALVWLAPPGWVVVGLAATAFSAGATIGMSVNHLIRYGLAAHKLRGAAS
jgi:membrane protein CcdC involved in cytochrome C biogenesis